jgi:protein-L-isoaspartate(D-aspartate) O-methyltransferase
VTTEANKIRLVMELRRQGITDTAVLGAIERIPREAFVPGAFRDRAYENVALPIGHGQTISQPAVVGYMTQELELGERMKVLEIGTGSGYQAAILSRLCRRVYTVERSAALLRDAERIFRDLRLNNITTRLGDGGAGWPGQAPFERIIVTAAAADVPPALLDQLAPDGIMILPVGETADTQQLLKCRRAEAGIDYESLWPVRFVPLVAGVENGGE